MRRFPCPHLEAEVELSDERAAHIRSRHPEVLPTFVDRIGCVLLHPDAVRRSARTANARLFSKWYDGDPEGKHLVVVVVSDVGPPRRHWIVTAYVARKLAAGDIQWPTS